MHTEIDLAVDEDLEEIRFYLSLLHLILEDREGLDGGDRRLVRAVRGRERIVNVADRHHPRLHRYRLAGNPSRIAAPVKLLVVTIRDQRNVVKGLGPGDRGQESIGMGDVTFDFETLFLSQTPLRDRK